MFEANIHGALPEIFVSLDKGLVDAGIASARRPSVRERMDLATQKSGPEFCGKAPANAEAQVDASPQLNSPNPVLDRS